MSVHLDKLMFCGYGVGDRKPQEVSLDTTNPHPDDRSINTDAFLSGLDAELKARCGIEPPQHDDDPPDRPRILAVRGLRSAYAAFHLCRHLDAARVAETPAVFSPEPDSPATAFAALAYAVERAIGIDLTRRDKPVSAQAREWVAGAREHLYHQVMAATATEYLCGLAVAGDETARERGLILMTGLGGPRDLRGSDPLTSVSAMMHNPHRLVAFGTALGQIPPERRLAASCAMVRFADEAMGLDKHAVFGHLISLMARIYS